MPEVDTSSGEAAKHDPHYASLSLQELRSDSESADGSFDSSVFETWILMTSQKWNFQNHFGPGSKDQANQTAQGPLQFAVKIKLGIQPQHHCVKQTSCRIASKQSQGWIQEIEQKNGRRNKQIPKKYMAQLLMYWLTSGPLLSFQILQLLCHLIFDLKIRSMANRGTTVNTNGLTLVSCPICKVQAFKSTSCSWISQLNELRHVPSSFRCFWRNKQ